jgi:hypothetical protein
MRRSLAEQSKFRFLPLRALRALRALREGMSLFIGGSEHSDSSCRTDGNKAIVRTCWSANQQVGLRETLEEDTGDKSPFP